MNYFLLALLISAQSFAAIPDGDRARSAYLRADPIYPLGNERSFRLLRELSALGVKHLTVEIRLAVENLRANRVDVARFRGMESGLTQYRAFFAGAKNYELTLTIKPVFVLPDGKTIVEPDPADPVQFLSSYESAMSFLAKLARISGTEELVVGTGLGNLICGNPSLVAGVIHRIKNVLPGTPGSELELRLDYSSEADFQRIRSCSGLKEISKRGQDLPTNPSAKEAVELLGRQVLLSRVSFDGPAADQAVKAQAFVDGLRAAGYIAPIPASWGVFNTSPYSVGNTDASESPRGKPFATLLKTWFQ